MWGLPPALTIHAAILCQCTAKVGCGQENFKGSIAARLTYYNCRLAVVLFQGIPPYHQQPSGSSWLVLRCPIVGS